MLAVAMLIDDRFPLYAHTSGDIDRAQAEQARAMLRDTLGVEVALPLSVEGARLLERIGRYVPGKGMLERACDACGLTLTEDAWAWIDAEDDPELLELPLVFAAMKEQAQQFWNMRRALFERRAFAQAVLAASKDDDLCAEVAEMVRRENETCRPSPGPSSAPNDP
jgi:hypothetical protein